MLALKILPAPVLTLSLLAAAVLAKLRQGAGTGRIHPSCPRHRTQRQQCGHPCRVFGRSAGPGRIETGLPGAGQDHRAQGRSGHHGQKGQVLMQLDPEDLRLSQAQARATLQAAETTRDLAKAELEALPGAAGQEFREPGRP
ncbi:hypothetical protein LP419_00070 [Massilia sp. H-1]|nr:hypothetical protein LP419_00070 [Massilia sp. H-1]